MVWRHCRTIAVSITPHNCNHSFLAEPSTSTCVAVKTLPLYLSFCKNFANKGVQYLEAAKGAMKGFGSSDKNLTKEVGAGADLLTKLPCQKERNLLRALYRRTLQRTPKHEMLTNQDGGAPDCLVRHLKNTSAPLDWRERHNPPNGTLAQDRKIHISEIRLGEFQDAYRNGETTAVVKFSQNEKQIDLRRINITTELAIQNKKEKWTKAKTEEDSLESLVL